VAVDLTPGGRRRAFGAGRAPLKRLTGRARGQRAGRAASPGCLGAGRNDAVRRAPGGGCASRAGSRWPGPRPWVPEWCSGRVDQRPGGARQFRGVEHGMAHSPVGDRACRWRTAGRNPSAGPHGQVDETASLGGAATPCGAGTRVASPRAALAGSAWRSHGRHGLRCHEPNHDADGGWQQFDVSW